MRATNHIILIMLRCVLALLICLTATTTSGFAQSATPQAETLATPQTEPPTIDVDCSAGDSLADALARHGSGSTFSVAGTCMERVSVTHDDVTINGGGSAVLDAAEDPEGPVVHVDGARNVTIRDITVQNGQHGILVESLSTITLEGVVSQQNMSHGIEVIQSHAVATNIRSHDNGRVGLIVNRSSEVRLTDSTLEANGISGLVLFSSAVARLEGANVIRGNAAQGVTLGMGGMIFTIGAELTIEDNGAEGLSLLQDGAAQFLGGSLTVRGNAGDGIALDLASTLVLGITDFGIPGEVLVEENDGHGISVTGASQLAIDAIMPATVQSNMGSGLYVDASDVRLDGSTIQENDGAELELIFGARATLENMMLAEVECGDAVLVRGTVSCS